MNGAETSRSPLRNAERDRGSEHERRRAAIGVHSDRRGDLASAFVSLADTLVAGYDVAEMLQQLVEHCVNLLDVPDVALLLADGEGALKVTASSSDQMRRLELYQLQTEDGPCLEAFATGAPVIAEGPDELEARWPAFADAMAFQGLQAVAAVPLRLRTDAVGALGLFSAREHAPDAMEVTLAQALADIATIAILQARAIHDSHLVSAQLQGALDTRVVIEQAKGVIAAQAGVSIAEAFARIRTYARGQGVKLTDVAAAIVTGKLRVEQLNGRPTPGSSAAGAHESSP